MCYADLNPVDAIATSREEELDQLLAVDCPSRAQEQRLHDLVDWLSQ